MTIYNQLELPSKLKRPLHNLIVSTPNINMQGNLALKQRKMNKRFSNARISKTSLNQHMNIYDAMPDAYRSDLLGLQPMRNS